VPPATEAPASLRCSFCLKPVSEVAKLIAGPGIYICDQCVGLCVDVLARDAASDSDEPPQLAHWKALGDDQLLHSLPSVASVATQAEGSLQRWVGEARRRGISWARIGSALGISRQSAWERFARDHDDQ
jgi:ATP-dependent Clp protease ATP-binding subunit ClpX